MKDEIVIAEDTYDVIVSGIEEAFECLNDAMRSTHIDCGDHAECDLCGVCRSLEAAIDYCDAVVFLVKAKCKGLKNEHSDS